MNISEAGVQFLTEAEGVKLTGYLDVAGIPTIGVGHTGFVDDAPVTEGMVIDKLKAEELLKQDLVTSENCISESVTVSLNQNQFDALCSLIFNIGTHAFKHSTVLKLLNEGNYTGAADAILMWSGSGNNSQVLLPRRHRERDCFLK